MAFTLKSTQFRRERQRSWRDLEDLLGQIDREGLRNLPPSDLGRLPSLYRSAVSSLSVANAISLDRNLLQYLAALAGRAYVVVYGAKRTAGEVLAELFVSGFPRLVRAHSLFVLAALLLLAAGTLTGYSLTAADPEAYYSFVPEELAAGRNPAASTADLRAVLYSQQDRFMLGAFASYLFTHNARVGILCFALGIAAGAPVPFLLFGNGLGLGAMAALYQSRGLGSEFWAWVLPHGITELLAVGLCGAAGMLLGGCLLFPGRHTRLENLARRGRQAALLVAGAVAMLLVAGLIEGLFRQLVHAPPVRWAVALASLAFWALYFPLAGTGRDDADPA